MTALESLAPLRIYGETSQQKHSEIEIDFSKQILTQLTADDSFSKSSFLVPTRKIGSEFFFIAN